mmetsp:Transcript_23269/g.59323  ORF Transcript_23269/g.59323 Transcript_23269/m.59323 type:complete len:226 (-) Transcript_23269:448-1125(-)
MSFNVQLSSLSRGPYTIRSQPRAREQNQQYNRRQHRRLRPLGPRRPASLHWRDGCRELPRRRCRRLWDRLAHQWQVPGRAESCRHGAGTILARHPVLRVPLSSGASTRARMPVPSRQARRDLARGQPCRRRQHPACKCARVQSRVPRERFGPLSAGRAIPRRPSQLACIGCSNCPHPQHASPARQRATVRACHSLQHAAWRQVRCAARPLHLPRPVHVPHRSRTY